MQKIAHRINTLTQLKAIPLGQGIELDVRYHENSIVLHHDPFHHHDVPQPELFEDILRNYNCQGPIIVNVKTEGIEQECIKLLNKYKIKHWFFLDLSMPYFVIYAKKAEDHEIEGFSSENLAVRFSEYEAIEYALKFAGKVRWVWVDCFTKMPLTASIFKKFKESGFKICIVSPELQKHPKEWISEFKKQLDGIPINAVCTKFPELW